LITRIIFGEDISVSSSLRTSNTIQYKSWWKNNTGRQRFCPMRKNVCFVCIFEGRIQICFQNFSITHIFRSWLKGWNLLRQDTKVFFSPWAPWRIQGFLLPGRWCRVLQW
jgi:hypothetical protein